MDLRNLSLHRSAPSSTAFLVVMVILILIITKTFAVDDEEPDGTSLKFIDKEVADACLRCLCDYRKSCNKTTCTGDKLGVSGYFCGPFRISKPYWNDAGRVGLTNETSNDEMKIFEHCTTNYDCSKQVVLAYSKRYMTDCDGDGVFTCADIIRLHDMGPECKGDVPMETSNRLDRINQCYVHLTGQPINPGRGPIPNTRSSSLHYYIAAGAGTFVLLVLLVAGLAILRCWLVKTVQREQGCSYSESELEDGQKKTLKREGGDAAINLPLTYIIPPDELIIYQEKRLGQGQFGLVVEGLYNGSRVAVKIPKLSLIVSTIEDFEKEFEMMARVGSHSNIVTFYGAEISQIRRGIVHVVLEFSRFGSLLNFMRTYEKSLSQPGEVHSSGYVNLMPDMAESREAEFTAEQLKLKWGYQLASALAFLESQKVLHGDVAARNVLVFELSVVKLSDFGFARWLGGYDDYEKREGPMPWRWMAPESLEKRLFSLKSDVWSFGVTLWEIFTFGVVPYLDWDNCNYNFVAGLKGNHRLERPEGARTEIYSLMLRCWELSPEDRPTFEELEKWLASLADSNKWPYEESLELSKSTDP